MNFFIEVLFLVYSESFGYFIIVEMKREIPNNNLTGTLKLKSCILSLIL